MIQNYRLLKESATKFNDFKEEGEGVSPQIQKIYSTAHFIILVLRFKGVTRYLYMGRGGAFQGIWWFEKLPPPKYRIQRDRLLETFRKYLRGHRIDSIEIPTGDRFFKINCSSKTYQCSLYWLIKGSQGFSSLEFETNNQRQYLHFWEGKIKNRNKARENFLEEFVPMGLDLDKEPSEDLPAKTFDQQEYFSILEKGGSSTTPVSGKRLLRKIENIKGDIIKLEKGVELEKELSRPDFQIPEGRKVKLNGIKFRFETGDSFYKKRDLIYQKVKRLKKAIKLQRERLTLAESQNKGKVLEFSEIKVIQPVWFFRQNEKGDKRKENSSRELRADFFKTDDGLILAVGRDARGNDQLRSQWGKKDDTWFHVEGYRGSHLLARGNVKPEHFALVGSILRDYSKLDINDIPLIYSQLNKVKGLKGQQGAVTIKNPRHIQVIYLPDWKAIISAHI